MCLTLPGNSTLILDPRANSIIYSKALQACSFLIILFSVESPQFKSLHFLASLHRHTPALAPAGWVPISKHYWYWPGAATSDVRTSGSDETLQTLHGSSRCNLVIVKQYNLIHVEIKLSLFCSHIHILLFREQIKIMMILPILFYYSTSEVGLTRSHHKQMHVLRLKSDVNFDFCW